MKKPIIFLLFLMLIILHKQQLTAQMPLVEEIKIEQKEGKFGLTKGEKSLVPFKYDSLANYRKIYYKAKMDNKWGMITEEGEIKIPFEYESLKNGENKFIIAVKNSKEGVIDIDNNKYSSFEYEKIDHIEKDTTILVKQKGEWFIIDKNGVKRENQRLIFSNPTHRALFEGCNYKSYSKYEDKIKCSNDEMLKYIYKNISYPTIAKESWIEGTVVISFLVSPEGEIVEEIISREIGGGCGEVSLGIVKSMKNWIPAENDGVKVWNHFYLPVKFILQ